MKITVKSSLLFPLLALGASASLEQTALVGEEGDEKKKTNVAAYSSPVLSLSSKEKHEAPLLKQDTSKATSTTKTGHHEDGKPEDSGVIEHYAASGPTEQHYGAGVYDMASGDNDEEETMMHPVDTRVHAVISRRKQAQVASNRIKKKVGGVVQQRPLQRNVKGSKSSKGRNLYYYDDYVPPVKSTKGSKASSSSSSAYYATDDYGYGRNLYYYDDYVPPVKSTKGSKASSSSSSAYYATDDYYRRNLYYYDDYVVPVKSTKGSKAASSTASAYYYVDDDRRNLYYYDDYVVKSTKGSKASSSKGSA